MRTTIQQSVEDLLVLTVDKLAEPGRSGCRRIIDAGGKRLRPDLLAHCAAAGSTASFLPSQRRSGAGGADRQQRVDPTDVVWAGAAIELLHTATLIHDDLLDDSTTRRGVPSVHHHEGRSAAVLSGDALIAQSWRLIARVGGENVDDLAAALADMCDGQALEEQLRWDGDADPLEVLRVARLKTGALLAAACRIGGRLGGCPEKQVEALGRYGADFGVALQLMDDALDVISDARALGKPVGADFSAGTVTMPLIFAIGRPNTSQGRPTGDPVHQPHQPNRAAELRSLLRPGLPASDYERARQLLLHSESGHRTVALAEMFARRAARSVSAIPGFAGRLAGLPGRFVQRQVDTKVVCTRGWIGAGTALDQNWLDWTDAEPMADDDAAAPNPADAIVGDPIAAGWGATGRWSARDASWAQALGDSG